MKKSEIKLIICGIASLVISVILAIIAVIVFIAIGPCIPFPRFRVGVEGVVVDNNRDMRFYTDVGQLDTLQRVLIVFMFK